MSRNDELLLENLTFTLHYPRANQPNLPYHAAILAIENNTVRHSTVSQHTGTTKQAAFKQLKAEMECRLGLMLLTKPKVEAFAKVDEGAGILPPPYPGVKKVVDGALQSTDVS